MTEIVAHFLLVSKVEVLEKDRISNADYQGKLSLLEIFAQRLMVSNLVLVNY